MYPPFPFILNACSFSKMVAFQLTCTIVYVNIYLTIKLYEQYLFLDLYTKPLVPDPYVRVTFSYQSQVTETLTQTLCPTWDQTLIFKEVHIFDDPRDLVQNPPSVVMEIFDYDKVCKFCFA